MRVWVVCVMSLCSPKCKTMCGKCKEFSDLFREEKKKKRGEILKSGLLAKLKEVKC